jgi:hypothetical protein
VGEPKGLLERELELVELELELEEDGGKLELLLEELELAGNSRLALSRWAFWYASRHSGINQNLA